MIRKMVKRAISVSAVKM